MDMTDPAFMARMQARLDALLLADGGVPLADALRQSRERSADLFDQPPQDATVVLASAEQEVRR